MKEILTINGCFDILSAGHIKLLAWATNEAKKKNLRLVVLINSDKSIRKLKGKKRPINPMQERFDQLKNFPGVDDVCVFPEDNPVELLKKIKPKCHIFSREHQFGPELALVKEGYIEYALMAPEPLQTMHKEIYSSSRIIEKVLKNGK